jgi:hypothetical protein
VFIAQAAGDNTEVLRRSGYNVRIDKNLMDSICSFLTSDVLILSGSAFPATIAFFSLPWQPVVLEELRKEYPLTIGYFLPKYASIHLKNGAPIVSKLEFRNTLQLAPSIVAKTKFYMRKNLLQDLKSKDGEKVTVTYWIDEFNSKIIVNISIARNSCVAFKGIEVSSSPTMSDIIKQDYGPDEILVFLEGISMQSHVAMYEGCNNCKYFIVYQTIINTLSDSTVFHLPVAGKHWLKIVHLRSKFAALNELHENWPSPTYYIITENSFKITNGAVKNLELGSNNNCNLNWLSKDGIDPLLLLPAFMKNANSNLHGDLDGSTYINVSATSYLWTSRVETKEGTACPQQDINNFRWARSPWQKHYINSVKCKNDIITPEEFFHSNIKNLVGGSKVLFVGDSHARYAKILFEEWCMKDSGCGISLDYIDSNYCDTFDIKAKGSISTPDLILLNCGHHPASGTHYTYLSYQELVSRAIQDIISKGYSAENFFWIESNVNPLRDDNWVKDYRDWRTVHRIHLFNRIATKIVKDSGFEVIKTFEWTLPLSDKLCDVGHYTASGALFPLFHSIVNILYDSKKGKLE